MTPRFATCFTKPKDLCATDLREQTTLGIQPIEEVNVSLKSRDELPPVIAALKHIYITPELNEKIFAVLEEKIIANKKKTGRPGMDLWRILVLAVIRHTLETNWDRMEHIANHDRMVRQILGVHVTDWKVPEEEFAYQTIVDNVSLIDETMLEEINRIVAEYGQRLLKKKTTKPSAIKRTVMCSRRMFIFLRI